MTGCVNDCLAGMCDCDIRQHKIPTFRTSYVENLHKLLGEAHDDYNELKEKLEGEIQSLTNQNEKLKGMVSMLRNID